MIYNSFYVTHGLDIITYLYDEDSKRPWAILQWCSICNGFIEIFLFEEYG
jgi:hypothetical protein